MPFLRVLHIQPLVKVPCDLYQTVKSLIVQLCAIPEGSSHPALVKVPCDLYQLVKNKRCAIPEGCSHSPRVEVLFDLYQTVKSLIVQLCAIPEGSSHPALVKVPCDLYQQVMSLIVQLCAIPEGSSHPALVKVPCDLYQQVKSLIVQLCAIPEGSSHPALVKDRCDFFYQLAQGLGFQQCPFRETMFSSSHPLQGKVPSLQDYYRFSCQNRAFVENPCLHDHNQLVKYLVVHVLASRCCTTVRSLQLVLVEDTCLHDYYRYIASFSNAVLEDYYRWCSLVGPSRLAITKKSKSSGS